MQRRTLSLDLRERILACYDEGKSTREDVARRFQVSLGMVKKLLQQRRHVGTIAPLHHLGGRKPLIKEEHKQKVRELLAAKVDMTLEEMRRALGIDCSLQAIHVVLAKMGLTYKKRHFTPASSPGPTSSRHDRSGVAVKAASTRQGSSSLTKARRRRT